MDGIDEPRRYSGKTIINLFRDFNLTRPLSLEKVVFGEWTEVRDSPETQNEYDGGFSAGMGYVSMGNIITIVSSYGAEAPCRGTLLSYNQTGDWAMVVLDDACITNLQFSYSKGDFLRVGWVETGSFKPVEKRSFTAD
ncbi:hypothetical protein C4J81_00585 [Deltaproteobacteria bacterium Smac51]|nr:hypothetical protein C4J81_00585 [Deltaproteobacteria bacterium Smac51]